LNNTLLFQQIFLDFQRCGIKYGLKYRVNYNFGEAKKIKKRNIEAS
jgi:hypothetical protein